MLSHVYELMSQAGVFLEMDAEMFPPSFAIPAGYAHLR
jgi:hypothetical protein